MRRAFNFGRQFMYKWTVNWRLIPEDMFLDRRFHIMLLVLHLFFMSLLLLRFIRYVFDEFLWYELKLASVHIPTH